MSKERFQLRCLSLLQVLLIVFGLVLVGCNRDYRNQYEYPTPEHPTVVEEAPELIPTTIPESLQVSPVTNTGSNLHIGPGTDFPRAGKLYAGTPVRPVALTSDGAWLKLDMGHWIAAQLVDNIPPGLPLVPLVEPRPTATPIVWMAVTSTEILATYRSNEIAGYHKYANRPLEVTGRINGPFFKDADQPSKGYVVPLTSEKSRFQILLCQMGQINIEWVADLVSGDIVTVRGYIRDKELDFVIVDTLNLEECEPIAP